MDCGTYAESGVGVTGIKNGLGETEPFGGPSKTFGKQELKPDDESQGEIGGIACGLEINLWCGIKVESSEWPTFLFNGSRCFPWDDLHGAEVWWGSEVGSEREDVHGVELILWLGIAHESTPS